MVLQAVLILLGLAAYPDAVHLDYRASVSFNDDGSITESTSTRVIPLNGRGVRRYSSMTLSHRSGIEEIEILQASVGHWRGGRGSSRGTFSTGPHSILTATGRMESSLRETVITMPGVEVGDTVMLHIERTISDLPLSRVYSYSFSPVMDDSVAHSSFRIENPAGVRLYSSQPGEHFVFTGVSPLPSHPLAAVKTSWISIATGSPETLSSEASVHIDIPWHGECEELERVIQSVGTDPGELRSWMAENISYIGTDSGVWPGWSPRSPEETHGRPRRCLQGQGHTAHLASQEGGLSGISGTRFHQGRNTLPGGCQDIRSHDNRLQGGTRLTVEAAGSHAQGDSGKGRVQLRPEGLHLSAPGAMGQHSASGSMGGMERYAPDGH